MANIRKLPSGRYNVQIRRKNKPYLTNTFDTKEEAARWAREQEKPTQKRQTQIVQLTLMFIGNKYCNTVLKGRPSRQTAIYRLNTLAANLPENAEEVTKDDVNTFRLNRLEQVSPTTCRDELLFLHRIYRWANREGLIACSSPCGEVPRPIPNKPRRKIVSSAELKLLLSALSPIMQVIVELAYETAMRRGEIVKLTPNNLHLDERVLTVIDGKTGDRSVPLTNRAVDLLREAEKRSKGSGEQLFPVTSHAVSTAVRRARKKVGLSPDVRMHQLRHTRITTVARKGFNQSQIMMVSGHKDVRSVQMYTHLNVRDVVALLD
jgi:integrase